MAYEIMINEEQKNGLILLLKELTPEQRMRYLGKDAPLEYWESMLADLKDDESNSWTDPETGKRKHMLHGFCL